MKRVFTRIVLAFAGMSLILWAGGCDPQRDECRWNPTTQRVKCGDPPPRDASDCDPSRWTKRCPR